MKTVDEVARLRAFVHRHSTQKEAAKALRISRPYLSRLLSGRETFSEDMLHKLGLSRIVVEAR